MGINERARRLLLPGLLASPSAQLAAVCSRDPEKARAAAHDAATRSGGDVRPFHAVQEMIRSGEIDAVYVNTPVETHVDVCTIAIDARCAVICEKPLAPTAAEAIRLAVRAGEAGVPTAVNFTYRSMPGYRLAERWLSRQTLGQPLLARFDLLQGHNFLPEFTHGSALLDSGSHLFDLMSGLLQAAGMGRMTAVRGEPLLDGAGLAAGAGAAGSVEQLDHGWAFHARTGGGVVASALFSRSALGWRNGLRWTLAGDRAALEVELDAGRTLARAALRDDGAPQGAWRPVALPEDIAADDARFPVYHMDRLVRAVRGEEAFPDFAAAVEANQVAEALKESAQSGDWAAVPPDHPQQ